MAFPASTLWTQFTNVPLFEIDKFKYYLYTIKDNTLVTNFTVINRLILELTDFTDLKKRESNLELLKNIIKVDKSLLENTLSNGISPLFLAIMNNILDVTKILLENGANVNYKNEKFGNAMIVCVQYNSSYDIMKL
jgi:ankyrin repeat protein